MGRRKRQAATPGTLRLDRRSLKDPPCAGLLLSYRKKKGRYYPPTLLSLLPVFPAHHPDEIASCDCPDHYPLQPAPVPRHRCNTSVSLLCHKPAKYLKKHNTCHHEIKQPY